MAHGEDLDPVLASLASCPAALDVLCELAGGPLTPRGLRARLGSRRRTLEATLRVLAAHGTAVRRDHAGSWDQRDPEAVAYQLTGLGRDLVRQLDHFEVLVATYEWLLSNRSDRH
jgi:DNA-binding HxlR family transcriptional regulator